MPHFASSLRLFATFALFALSPAGPVFSATGAVQADGVRLPGGSPAEGGRGREEASGAPEKEIVIQAPRGYPPPAPPAPAPTSLPRVVPAPRPPPPSAQALRTGLWDALNYVVRIGPAQRAAAVRDFLQYGREVVELLSGLSSADRRERLRA